MSFQRFVAVSAFALASSATSSAFAHAKLQSSDPQAGSTLAHAPRQLRLKFDEALEPAFSKIRLVGPAGRVIPVTATVDKTDPATMSAPLPALPAGGYRVQWSAMAHDGHKTKGEFTFQVK